MPKFDKEGNRLVCENHVDCVMPGQTHKIVAKSYCFPCRQQVNKKQQRIRRLRNATIREEKKAHELQHMKKCSLRNAAKNRLRKLNKLKNNKEE